MELIWFIAGVLFALVIMPLLETFTSYLMTCIESKKIKHTEAINDGNIRTLTNNNGGINGGISNSMPIVFRCVLKPTPSILKEQRSIDENFNNTILEIKGRHDPCIVRRARVVIDSLVALCLLDLISINEGKKWMC